MTTAPANDQRRLLDVQALDTRADQLKHRRATLPEVAALKAIDAQRTQANRALVAARTAADDRAREVAKAEADVTQVRTRAERDQARLDSGTASLKDVHALTAEIDHLATRQAALEETELEAMERLEAAQAQADEAQAAFDAVDAQAATACETATAAVAQVNAQMAQVVARRGDAASGVDAKLLALYDKLRAQHGGLGAGRLLGNRCQGCQMVLNPLDLEKIHAAPADQVVRCEECGRILVRAGD